MALKRLALGTLAACLLATLALVPPRGGRLRGLVIMRGTFDTPAAERARTTLHMAERDLRIARTRDSLLERVEPDARVSVFIDPAVPEHAARFASETIKGRSEDYVGATGHHLIVTLVLEKDRWQQNNNVYLLPDSNTDPCIVWVGLTPWDVEHRIPIRLPSFARSLRYRIPGPCGFYIAFGSPGGPVRAWLAGSHYMWAAGPRWQLGASEPLGDYGAGLLQQLGVLGLRACAQGNLEICSALAMVSAEGEDLRESLLLSRAFSMTSGTTASQSRLDNVVTLSASSWSGLGPNGRHLLSDLVVEFGTDRFTTFWTSDRPVPEAFADAFGIPLDQWIHGWARVQFGPIRNGPGVPAPTYVLGIFLSVVFVGGSTLLVRRRQVR